MKNDTLKKPLSDDLEEAAEEIVVKMHPCMEDCIILGDRLTRGELTALVKAGAKWQKEQKPAWSEEDERRIDAICELLENTSAIHPNYSHRKLIIWLKSLRPVSKESLQPHWKPSEEQMEALKTAKRWYSDNMGCNLILESLFEQLEKQM